MKRSRRVVFLIMLTLAMLAGSVVAHAQAHSTTAQVADGDEADKARGMYIW